MGGSCFFFSLFWGPSNFHVFFRACCCCGLGGGTIIRQSQEDFIRVFYRVLFRVLFRVFFFFWGCCCLFRIFFFPSESRSQQVGGSCFAMFLGIRVVSFKLCFGQLGTHHQQVSPQKPVHFGVGRIALGVWQYSQATPCVVWLGSKGFVQLQECAALLETLFHEKECITFLPFFLPSFSFVYNNNKHYSLLVVMQIHYVLPYFTLGLPCQRVFKFVH